MDLVLQVYILINLESQWGLINSQFLPTPPPPLLPKREPQLNTSDAKHKSEQNTKEMWGNNHAAVV